MSFRGGLPKNRLEMRTLLFRLFIILFLLSFALLDSCRSTHYYTETIERKPDSIDSTQFEWNVPRDTTQQGNDKIDQKRVSPSLETMVDLHQDLTQIHYLEEPIATNVKLEVYYNLGFSFAFSKHYKQSLWVAYQFLPSELQKVAKRESSFKQDSRVSETANNGDYTRTGYDKGHLAPAADMSWSPNAMKESFYFTNISPQLAAFNRGIWKKLEEQIRDWVARNDTIYITTGPLFLDLTATIGRNKIPIPSHFYKALLTRRNSKWKAVGYFFPNANLSADLDSFRCTIDSLETISGFDFFPLLPDSVEWKIEREYDKLFWHAK